MYIRCRRHSSGTVFSQAADFREALPDPFGSHRASPPSQRLGLRQAGPCLPSCRMHTGNSVLHKSNVLAHVSPTGQKNCQSSRCLIALNLEKTTQTDRPRTPITENRKAAPDPFPLPKSVTSTPSVLPSITGSNTLSTRKPPSI